MAYNAEAGQRANAPGKESDAMNIDPRVDSTTPNPAAQSSTAYTFEQHPPERGQLASSGNKWGVVINQCEQGDRFILIDGVVGTYTTNPGVVLLLPSPRQCRAARLNIPKCLRFVLPGCYPGDSRLMRVLEADKLVIEAMDLPLVGRPWFVRASGFSDDPAVLETAANRMHALQSWLAGWNKEAANGE